MARALRGDERDVDLRRHWDTITTHWWLPLTGLVAGVVIGYLISLGGAQVYKAKAVVYLGQPLSPGGSAQIQSQATNPSTVRTIIHSEAALRAAARQAGMPVSKLRGHVSSQTVSGSLTKLGQTPLVRVTVTGGAPRKIGIASNALAGIVIASRAASASADYGTSYLLLAIVIVVLAVVWFLSRRAQARKAEENRQEARELREGAEQQRARADERLSLAEEQAEQARAEQAAATDRLRRADEVDPDVDVDTDADADRTSDAERDRI